MSDADNKVACTFSNPPMKPGTDQGVCSGNNTACFIEQDGAWCLPSDTPNGCNLFGKTTFEPLAQTGDKCIHCPIPKDQALKDRIRVFMGPSYLDEAFKTFGNCETGYCTSKNNVCVEPKNSNVGCAWPGQCSDGFCKYSGYFSRNMCQGQDRMYNLALTMYLAVGISIFVILCLSGCAVGVCMRRQRLRNEMDLARRSRCWIIGIMITAFAILAAFLVLAFSDRLFVNVDFL